MSVDLKILVAVLWLSCSVALVSSGQTQEQTVDRTDFGDGALEEVSGAMERLLQLEWNGQNLELKRDWDGSPKKKENKEADKNDELEKAIEKLVERGVPEAQAKQMAATMVENGNARGGRRNFHFGSKRSGVEKIFYAIQSKFGSGSSGSSGNGVRQQLTFSNKSLSGVAVIGKDDVSFEFSESAKERGFEISDDGKGQFKFEFSFDNLFIRLLQSKTGKTQLIWISNDQVEVYVGDSFSNFQKRNSKVVDKMLFPLFEQLGIKLPLGVPDP